MTATLSGNNARTEAARRLCQEMNNLFCQQDERIVALETAVGLCPAHLSIADKLFDYPQKYGCPQCQRNRTCELEELSATLLRCLRAVLFVEQKIHPKPLTEDERTRLFLHCASAVEAMDDFNSRDCQSGGLNESESGNSNG